MMASLFTIQGSSREELNVHVLSYPLLPTCISPVSFFLLSLSLSLRSRLAHIARIRAISQADVRSMNSFIQRYTTLLTR